MVNLTIALGKYPFLQHYRLCDYFVFHALMVASALMSLHFSVSSVTEFATCIFIKSRFKRCSFGRDMNFDFTGFSASSCICFNAVKYDMSISRVQVFTILPDNFPHWRLHVTASPFCVIKVVSVRFFTDV